MTVTSFQFPSGFPGGTVVKNPPADAGDSGLIPGSGVSPEEGNGHPFLPGEFCAEEPGRLQSMGSQRVRHD